MVVKDEVASSNLAISSNKRGEKPCVSCLFCFSPVTFDYLSIFAHFREIWQKVDQKVDLFIKKVDESSKLVIIT